MKQFVLGVLVVAISAFLGFTVLSAISRGAVSYLEGPPVPTATRPPATPSASPTTGSVGLTTPIGSPASAPTNPLASAPTPPPATATARSAPSSQAASPSPTP